MPLLCLAARARRASARARSIPLPLMPGTSSAPTTPRGTAVAVVSAASRQGRTFPLTLAAVQAEEELGVK